MASTASDPDAAILVDTISRNDIINIYALSRKVKWSYGKTERKVADLIKAGKLYYWTKVKDGRNIKLISLQPIVESNDSTSRMPEIVKKAYVDLYGVFLALGRKDSNDALSKYADKVQKQPNELTQLFTEALKLCNQKLGDGTNG